MLLLVLSNRLECAHAVLVEESLESTSNSPQSSVLSPQSSVLSPQSSVLSPQSSVLRKYRTAPFVEMNYGGRVLMADFMMEGSDQDQILVPCARARPVLIFCAALKEDILVLASCLILCSMQLQLPVFSDPMLRYSVPR
jgi:hypothetical protein